MIKKTELEKAQKQIKRLKKQNKKLRYEITYMLYRRCGDNVRNSKIPSELIDKFDKDYSYL